MVFCFQTWIPCRNTDGEGGTRELRLEEEGRLQKKRKSRRGGKPKRRRRRRGKKVYVCMYVA